ncbi:hypothetical protein BJX66DRAFT_319611 [Aspergillus keveii]|uniref:Uncharacterized protein n=1 Tax=Aspergillus keveii TaxID=714993 RepID=A0ABR4FHZ5_9EURO
MNAGTQHKQTATHLAEALLRTRLPTLRHDHEVLGNLNCASFLLGLSTLFFLITIFLLLTAGHLRHSHYHNRMATILLRCYAAAQRAGLTSRNIPAGCKASGLWPINAAKPLMSWFVIPSSKNTTTITPVPQIAETKRKELAEDNINTPASSYNVRHLLACFTSSQKADITTRRLFRKNGKGLDT